MLAVLVSCMTAPCSIPPEHSVAYNDEHSFLAHVCVGGVGGGQGGSVNSCEAGFSFRLQRSCSMQLPKELPSLSKRKQCKRTC